jgi:hypothetical protein
MVVEWTGSASYPAGGYTLDPKPLVGANNILGAIKLGGNAAAANYLIHWDTVNSKLMISYPTGGAGDSPATLGDPAQGEMTIEDHDDHAADQLGTIPAGATPVTSTAANGEIVTITAADAHSAHVVTGGGSGVPGRGKELLATTDASTLTFRLELLCY